MAAQSLAEGDISLRDVGQTSAPSHVTQTAEVTTAFGEHPKGVMFFGGVCHLTVLGVHIYSPIPEASRAATPSPAFGPMRSYRLLHPTTSFLKIIKV